MPSEPREADESVLLKTVRERNDVDRIREAGNLDEVQVTARQVRGLWSIVMLSDGAYSVQRLASSIG